MAFEGNFALDLIANFRDYFDYESHRGAANDLLKVLDTHIFGVQEAWTHKKQYACQCAQVRVSLCAQTSPQTPAGRSPMGGVPCSLLVWVSRSSSKRSMPGYDVMGDPFSLPTTRSNTLLSRFALLVLVAMSREVFWAIEQPQSSLLKDTPYYEYLFMIPQLKIILARMWGPYH